jgi:hypothetical protein
LLAAIKKSFGASDDKVVSDCLRFGLFCYQQGLVNKGGTLMDSLVNQVAGFEALRGRIEQTAAAIQQAVFVTSSVAISIELELAKHQHASNLKG